MIKHIRHRETEELLLSYDPEDPEKFEFQGKDLQYADFSKRELCNANFSGANLHYANFEGALLLDADFREADLSNAVFDRAVLQRANFYKAGLRDASLRKTHLTDTNFHNAFMEGANVHGARAWDTVGDGTVIQTIQTDPYTINITEDAIQIGCERHTHAEWMEFSDDYIDAMDQGALPWWETWKPILKTILATRNMR